MARSGVRALGGAPLLPLVVLAIFSAIILASLERPAQADTRAGKLLGAGALPQHPLRSSCRAPHAALSSPLGGGPGQAPCARTRPVPLTRPSALFQQTATRQRCVSIEAQL